MTLDQQWTMTDLGRLLRQEVRQAIYPTLVEARRLITEAGVPLAQERLRKAVDGLETAQRSYREAHAEMQAAQADLDSALLDAEWALDSRFVRESNRTYLTTPCPHLGHADHDEQCNCDGGTVRRQVTADEAKAWKAAAAHKAPEAAEAAERLRKLTDAALDARDAVTTADKRIGACRAELDASVAVLNALTAGLAAKER